MKNFATILKVLFATAVLAAGCFGERQAGSNFDPEVTAEASTDFVRVGTVITFTMDATDADGDIVSWLWDFGDGTTANSPNATHTYTTAGTYAVTATARDEDGANGSARLQITVTAEGAPTILLDSLTLHGSVDDESVAAIVYTIDGGKEKHAPVSDNAFSIEADIDADALTVDYSATDAAGNETAGAVNVTRP